MDETSGRRYIGLEKPARRYQVVLPRRSTTRRCIGAALRSRRQYTARRRLVYMSCCSRYVRLSLVSTCSSSPFCASLRAHFVYQPPWKSSAPGTVRHSFQPSIHPSIRSLSSFFALSWTSLGARIESCRDQGWTRRKLASKFLKWQQSVIESRRRFVYIYSLLSSRLLLKKRRSARTILNGAQVAVGVSIYRLTWSRVFSIFYYLIALLFSSFQPHHLTRFRFVACYYIINELIDSH